MSMKTDLCLRETLDSKSEGNGENRETKMEEEEEEANRATGVSRATFGVIESFVGTTKPHV